MAMGVAELKKELQEGVGLLEMPEIHQFLDGFYLSRIGIRILIGQHIALHEPEKENYIGTYHGMHCGLFSVEHIACRLVLPHSCGTIHAGLHRHLILTAVSQSMAVLEACMSDYWRRTCVMQA